MTPIVDWKVTLRVLCTMNSSCNSKIAAMLVHSNVLAANTACRVALQGDSSNTYETSHTFPGFMPVAISVSFHFVVLFAHVQFYVDKSVS